MHHDQWCNLEKMATELSCLGGEYRQIYEQSSLRENDSHSYSPFQVRGIRFIYIYKNNPSQLRNSVTLLDLRVSLAPDRLAAHVHHEVGAHTRLIKPPIPGLTYRCDYASTTNHDDLNMRDLIWQGHCLGQVNPLAMTTPKNC